MSPAPTLRDYQLEFIERCEVEGQAGRRRLMGVAPTGAGKTVIAAEVARRAVGRGERVLFLVHRRELVLQTAQKLHAAGLDHGVLAAGFAGRPGAPVQVASIATLHARAVRRTTLALPPAERVIVDEAHHATARTWRQLIDAYPEAAVLGLTATPCRADGRGLGSLFEALVECPPVAALTALGHLVPTVVFAPRPPDLSGVRSTAGDYDEADLARAMNTPRLVGDAVEHWLRHAAGRRTVAFAVDVGHAVHLRDAFGRAGVAAAHVDGTTPAAERDAVLSRLAAGTLDVVANCGVLTEGFDLPEIGCLVLARPTRSFGLYRQMVGRGLRAAPGKASCVVLDHAGCTHAHGFIDEPVEWTLAADRHAARPAAAARAAAGERPPALVPCRECGAARWEGQPCGACGWRPPARPRAVAVLEGELGRVARDGSVEQWLPGLEERRAFHRQLLWIARDRGYKPGWAAHKYREKFATWPPLDGAAEPHPPTAEVRAWVRSRQIAYARARDAGRLS